MRVLIITKIFPNAAEPLSSPFNRQQFAALSRLCEVEVLATLPWFPGARLLRRWSPAGQVAHVPRHEVIAGLSVHHPRVFFIPKVGHALAGAFYAASLLPGALARRGRFDVILAAWAFPDGVAAVALAKAMSVPVVVKVHGSDIDVLGKMNGPRQNLRWVLPHADAVVAVSRSLATGVAELGVAPDKIEVVRNGVDTTLFRPMEAHAARRDLGHGGDARKWLVFVGLMVKDKGILDLLAAFGRLAARRADVALAFVGDGPLRVPCEQLAAPLGDRVIFAGARPLPEIPLWMCAGQALVLPSHHEGTPNVLLEALACGRRVVASTVGGIPDVINRRELGELVPPSDVDALEGALERAVDAVYEPVEIVAAAGQSGWDDSAAHLHGVLARVVAARTT